MSALNLIFRSSSNRVFGCACSLLLAVAIARCGDLSAQTSTNLRSPSPPPATQSTCATPAAFTYSGGKVQVTVPKLVAYVAVVSN